MMLQIIVRTDDTFLLRRENGKYSEFYDFWWDAVIRDGIFPLMILAAGLEEGRGYLERFGLSESA